MFYGLRDGLMKNRPCKNCTERYPACHDTCPKYFAATMENEKEREFIKREKHKFTDLNSHVIESKQKCKRKHGVK